MRRHLSALAAAVLTCTALSVIPAASALPADPDDSAALEEIALVQAHVPSDYTNSADPVSADDGRLAHQSLLDSVEPANSYVALLDFDSDTAVVDIDASEASLKETYVRLLEDDLWSEWMHFAPIADDSEQSNDDPRDKPEQKTFALPLTVPANTAMEVVIRSDRDEDEAEAEDPRLLLSSATAEVPDAEVPEENRPGESESNEDESLAKEASEETEPDEEGLVLEEKDGPVAQAPSELQVAMRSALTTLSATTTSTNRAWNPASVTTDAIFYNATAMNESQIKAFIEKENAGCKPSGGATCLKDKTFATSNLQPERGVCQPLGLTGNQRAWTIIDRTAKACGINPQVILVTLQKESSAVVQPKTEAQWAKAMGSACPDNQPCNAAEAGFTKQIYYGTDKLAGYQKITTWGFNMDFLNKTKVTIPNNPDSTCGSQSFVLANKATAALYMYTPYIGGSSKTGCAAIAQKSFYNIMDRWFGGGTAGSIAVPVPPTTTPTVKVGVRSEIGHGWYSPVVYPGDWNGDGVADMMLVDSAGKLWLYAGSGRGGFYPRVQIGHGWHAMDWIGGGVDWDGDGNNDIVARTKTGELRLYPGNGRGAFKASRKIGVDWQGFSSLALTRTAAGPAIYGILGDRFYVYPGNGKGGFKTRQVLGPGWSVMDTIAAVGDWTGDGRPDIVARSKTGYLRLYYGTASGTISGAANIGDSWQTMSYIGVSDQSKPKAPLWPVGTNGKLWNYPVIS